MLRLPEAQFADESVSDLSDLNIPTLVDSLVEVMVLASTVPLQVHLSDYTQAGVGQEGPLDHHRDSQAVGLSSQAGCQHSLPGSQDGQPESPGSQDALGMLPEGTEGRSQLVNLFLGKEHSFAHFVCPWIKEFQEVLQ